MIQVVLDTNVLISALIRDGKPRKLFLEMVREKADLIFFREFKGIRILTVNDFLCLISYVFKYVGF
jgi:predicted nucleic acid-binding protein